MLFKKEKVKKSAIEHVQNMYNFTSSDNSKIDSFSRFKTKKSTIVRMNTEDYTHANDIVFNINSNSWLDPYHEHLRWFGDFDDELPRDDDNDNDIDDYINTPTFDDDDDETESPTTTNTPSLAPSPAPFRCPAHVPPYILGLS